MLSPSPPTPCLLTHSLLNKELKKFNIKQSRANLSGGGKAQQPLAIHSHSCSDALEAHPPDPKSPDNIVRKLLV